MSEKAHSKADKAISNGVFEYFDCSLMANLDEFEEMNFFYGPKKITNINMITSDIIEVLNSLVKKFWYYKKNFIDINNYGFYDYKRNSASIKYLRVHL